MSEEKTSAAMKLWCTVLTVLVVATALDSLLLWLRVEQQRDGIIEAYDRILKTNTNLLEFIKVYEARESVESQRPHLAP